MSERELTYFWDVDHGFLLAYERSSEFFVMYVPQTNAWEDCSISFSQFRHDYCFRELSRDEAARRASNNLPDALLQRYLERIGKA